MAWPQKTSWRLWGWKEVDGKFETVNITNQPGPENRLKYVRCQCKEDGCAGNTNCSCTKCNIVSCMNLTLPHASEEHNNIAEL